jgi:hypothetical protein
VTRWWQDPDLGRDRATKALGRRDWNWFTPYAAGTGAGTSPADIERGQPPWAPHPITAHDRHDRTLGIPPRHVSMWPDQQPLLDNHSSAPGERVAAILDDLRRLPPPSPPPPVPVNRLAEALADLAARVHARPAYVQAIATADIARQHRLDPTELGRLARGVGETIAKTSHRSTRGRPGDPTLNALAGANLHLAAEIYLARTGLARAAACSDPDLPRLWILANGLVHHVPASVLLSAPAHSVGPISRLCPTHDDLVGWYGIRAAVDHLDATLQAVHTGRSWLGNAPDTRTHRALALGVLDLTQPAAAYHLAGRGLSSVDLDQIRTLLSRAPPPVTIADLSDPALKAVCDRNGWLIGTADERTDRELVERRALAADAAAGGSLTGDPSRLTDDIIRNAPDDAALERSTWRGRPASLDAVQCRQLLGAGSREAIRRLAGLDIQPRTSRAAALAARYPDRLAQHTLRTPTADLTPAPDTPPPPDLVPAQIELDLGF